MKNKKVALIALIMVGLLSFVGCAKISDYFNKIKGKIVGENMSLNFYNDYGDKTLEVVGSKITINLLENNANFEVEGTGFESSVLEVTVNGDQIFQVGNTMIVEEEGLEPIENFEMKTTIDINNGGGYVPLDRYINDIKNKIGEEKTIIISSDLGIPIAVYEGKDVYVTIPEDLPKMTRLNIDGKTMYIHRANYIILDTDMIK